LFGKDVTGCRPEVISRMGVGRSFQVTSVFPELTVRENLQFALMSRDRKTRRVFGRAWRLQRDEAEEVLGNVGLDGLGEVQAGTLSHGDQRSLELALSIALRPKLLFLDEPTAGMAPEETQRAMALVRRLADEYQLTLVFTEHDMEVVFATAQRVTVLAQGRVLADGTPDEVRSNPAVREAYLGVKV
jgi:branched-chain amino acid transport system ATP-binding protein